VANASRVRKAVRNAIVKYISGNGATDSTALLGRTEFNSPTLTTHRSTSKKTNALTEVGVLVLRLGRGRGLPISYQDPISIKNLSKKIIKKISKIFPKSLDKLK
jgi:hypothetical protein